MRSLYEAVYGKWPSDKINGTRRLRYLITALRKDGIPICHTADPTGGGYYLASGGTDLENQCKRLRAQALRKLAMEARMRKIALPELIGQIGLALARDGEPRGE